MILRRCSTSSLLRFQFRFIHHDQIVRSTKSIDTSHWATSDTNPLIKQISARIKATGPITVAEFMRESLLNPNHVSKDNQHDRYVIAFFSFQGYYTRHEVFGKKGDFITAPEISQMFGEVRFFS